jgi:hypothetical protein
MRSNFAFALISTSLILVVQPAFGQIRNIDQFLDQCPSSDPALARIRSDFEIRRDGVPTALPACTEPVSLMPSAAYTDELMLLQAMRVMYSMDQGMHGHLPWTSGTLYDWVKSKVGGVNIVSSGGGPSCCVTFNGRPFVNIGAHDDATREFDKKWIYLSVIVTVYAHEARHIDGFPHSSCCGTSNGCDDTFDAGNLSPYGLQWWLNKLWLDGTIDVGMGCEPPLDLSNSTSWFIAQVNSTFPSRFCLTRPPVVSTPSTPGGACHDVKRRRAVRHS